MNADIEIRIYTKKYFTDKSLLDFLSERTDLQIEEYVNYLASNEIFSNLSSTALNFIASHDNGFLRPDKCDAYEPVKDKFDVSNLSNPIKWLSQPGGAFFCTKRKSYDAVFENNCFAPLWEDGNLMRPTVNEPMFKGEIRLYISANFFLKRNFDYWLKFLKSFSSVLSASYGFIALPEDIDRNRLDFSSVTEISELPIDIFWVNYYGEEWLSLFKERMDKLKEEVQVLKESKYGIITTHQDFNIREKQASLVLDILKKH